MAKKRPAKKRMAPKDPPGSLDGQPVSPDLAASFTRLNAEMRRITPRLIALIDWVGKVAIELPLAITEIEGLRNTVSQCMVLGEQIIAQERERRRKAEESAPAPEGSESA